MKLCCHTEGGGLPVVGQWGSLMTYMAGSVTTQSIAYNYVMGAVRVRRGSDSSVSACFTVGLAWHPRGGPLPSGSNEEIKSGT